MPINQLNVVKQLIETRVKTDGFSCNSDFVSEETMRMVQTIQIFGNEVEDFSLIGREDID